MNPRFRLICLCLCGATLLPALPLHANEPEASAGAVDTVFPETVTVAPSAPAQPAPAVSNATAAMAEINRRLNVIEARLGTTARPASIGYNIERRLADLERRVLQLEQKQARMQQWEQRIRRMEMK